MAQVNTALLKQNVQTLYSRAKAFQGALAALRDAKSTLLAQTQTPGAVLRKANPWAEGVILYPSTEGCTGPVLDKVGPQLGVIAQIQTAARTLVDNWPSEQNLSDAEWATLMLSAYDAWNSLVYAIGINPTFLGLQPEDARTERKTDIVPFNTQKFTPAAYRGRSVQDVVGSIRPYLPPNRTCPRWAARSNLPSNDYASVLAGSSAIYPTFAEHFRRDGLIGHFAQKDDHMELLWREQVLGRPEGGFWWGFKPPVDTGIVLGNSATWGDLTIFGPGNRWFTSTEDTPGDDNVPLVTPIPASRISDGRFFENRIESVSHMLYPVGASARVRQGRSTYDRLVEYVRLNRHKGLDEPALLRRDEVPFTPDFGGAFKTEVQAKSPRYELQRAKLLFQDIATVDVDGELDNAVLYYLNNYMPFWLSVVGTTTDFTFADLDTLKAAYNAAVAAKQNARRAKDASIAGAVTGVVALINAPIAAVAAVLLAGLDLLFGAILEGLTPDWAFQYPQPLFIRTPGNDSCRMDPEAGVRAGITNLGLVYTPHLVPRREATPSQKDNTVLLLLGAAVAGLLLLRKA